MRENRKMNACKYVPIWIPEYIFISLMRESESRNEEVSQLFLMAWGNFLSAGLKDQAIERSKKRNQILKSRRGKL